MYCAEHKKENMIITTKKNCQHEKCKQIALYGLINKRPQFCVQHKQPNMINLILENKCSILECNEEYNHICETIKYCNNHVPEIYTMIVKRLCKYCDIREDVDHIR